jgi:tRNA threonylcarbamoyladenosine biosynthesis protein TsaB
MLVLGIETSGLDGSVALVRDDVCLDERALNQVGRRHAQSLVLEIGELLQAQSLTPRDVELIAVSRGPGSFTGLRVGMTCAKTFAYATGCQFISVDTFAAIAENSPQEIHRLTVIEDAQREDLFVGEYVRDESGRWQLVSPIRIVPVNEFLQARTERDIVIGPGLKKRSMSGITSIGPVGTDISRPRASIIAILGKRASQQSSGDESSIDRDFWRVSPFYLRLSAAEEKRIASVAKDV